jgi:hypothetical protein
LSELANFVKNNLKPNRLAFFDTNSILNAKNYDGPIPESIQNTLKEK